MLDGVLRAYATSSFALRIGRLAFTARISAPLGNSVSGAKSLSPWYGSRL